jgi:hypothetical protein
MWSSLAACTAGSAASSPALAVPAPPGPAKGLIALIEMFLWCLV